MSDRLKVLNNGQMLFTTVAQKLNQSRASRDENGLFSFSGRLFCFIFGEAKKKRYWYGNQKNINS
jgi:hypothetical protein